MHKLTHTQEHKKDTNIFLNLHECKISGLNAWTNCLQINPFITSMINEAHYFLCIQPHQSEIIRKRQDYDLIANLCMLTVMMALDCKNHKYWQTYEQVHIKSGLS